MMTYWALNWRVPLRDLCTCENVLLKEKFLLFSHEFLPQQVTCLEIPKTLNVVEITLTK